MPLAASFPGREGTTGARCPTDTLPRIFGQWRGDTRLSRATTCARLPGGGGGGVVARRALSTERRLVCNNHASQKVVPEKEGAGQAHCSSTTPQYRHAERRRPGHIPRGKNSTIRSSNSDGGGGGGAGGGA
eukprot:365299-Chlamydomonas_euryale.AAC.8